MDDKQRIWVENQIPLVNKLVRQRVRRFPHLDAEEICAECYYQLCKASLTFDASKSNDGRYANRVVWYVVGRAWKKTVTGLAQSTFGFDSYPAFDEGSPDPNGLDETWIDKKKIVRQWYNLLPEDTKLILKLHYIDGIPISGIHEQGGREKCGRKIKKALQGLKIALNRR